MTRAVVVDDHPIFRKGLVALLRASEIEVVGEAQNGHQAIAVVQEELPDVVLMDVSMPELGGIDATARLVGEQPTLRVVVITMFDDEATVAQALEAGASAYVTKQASPAQILAAIAAAESGALFIGAGVPRPASHPTAVEIPGLTPRERAVADLLQRGLPNPVIAERLHLSTKTVANYVSIVMLKLGAADRADAARILRAGQL
ncbi:response regulator transcription factor [Diaminobutyricibacter sp. McL0618]|uniref:response regulator transcription factor n=1 Tax=Leifsonia sp. McL0618 TaxID=3415677 RepID=UPI003CF852D9